MRPQRYAWTLGILAVGASLVAGKRALEWGFRAVPLKIGVLYCRTGPRAPREEPVAASILLAAREINETGGVLGRPIQPILADGGALTEAFRGETERLFKEGVVAVIGGGESRMRRAIRPLFERRQHLLIYPYAYEGCEGSRNIVYLGSVPSQIALPAVKIAIDEIGPRIYVIGPDTAHTRISGELIRSQAASLGGSVVGVHVLGSDRWELRRAAARLRSVNPAPDVVFNLLDAAATRELFKELHAVGVGPGALKIISLQLSESDLIRMPADLSSGAMVGGCFFEGSDAPAASRFAKAFRAAAGPDWSLDGDGEAAYAAVYLLAQAIREARSDEPDAIRRALLHQGTSAPEGIIAIDPATQHAWRSVEVRQLLAGNLALTWRSARPLRPVPFPAGRSRQAWGAMVAAAFRAAR
jgi:urea transport system substrate-binding protein